MKAYALSLVNKYQAESQAVFKVRKKNDIWAKEGGRETKETEGKAETVIAFPAFAADSNEPAQLFWTPRCTEINSK